MWHLFVLCLLFGNVQPKNVLPFEISYQTIELNLARSLAFAMKVDIDRYISRPFLRHYAQNKSTIETVKVDLENSIDYSQIQFLSLLQNCTNILLQLDQPYPFASTVFFLFMSQEIETFDIADLVFNQTDIFPCVTKEDFVLNEINKRSQTVSQTNALPCPSSVHRAMLLAESTRNLTGNRLRPRVKPFLNSSQVLKQCLATESWELSQRSENFNIFKRCVNVMIKDESAGRVMVHFMYKAEDDEIYRNATPFFNQTYVYPCYTQEDLRKSKQKLSKSKPLCPLWFWLVPITTGIMVIVMAVYGFSRNEKETGCTESTSSSDDLTFSRDLQINGNGQIANQAYDIDELNVVNLPKPSVSAEQPTEGDEPKQEIESKV